MATAATVAIPRRKAPINRKSLSPSLPPVAAEAVALLDLKASSRPMRAGQEVVSEGRRCNAIYLINEGMAVRYRILRDGQRQILNFLLPGDFAGVTSCRFNHALWTVKTLTPAVVSPIPLARFARLFETDPLLAAKLIWAISNESAILSERLIAIGRRTATGRIAHFLLELLVRLQCVGLADERSYHLPLTQEMISDALGLSIPYLNRVLHQLRDLGLVHIKDQMVVIDDVDELSSVADFEHSYLRPLSMTEFMGNLN